ncbi:MAG: response regulator [Treponema sp.]|jgi:signal transduction histidine kinase|nr:response regulator [Treponema sp.]
MIAAVLRKKIFENIVVILFSIAAVIVLIISVYDGIFISSISSYLKENIEQRLLTTSRSLSSVVSAEELEELKIPQDMEKPLFQEIRRRLMDFAEENQVLYAYYLRIDEDGKFFRYIVDNDTDPETIVNLASDLEPVEEPELLLAARERKAFVTPPGEYAEGWNGIMSAYAPVFDREGRVAAVAGVDVNDQELLHSQRKQLILLSMVFLFLMFFIGLSTIYIYRWKERSFSRRFKQQALMSQLARSLITAEDTASLINESLRITGEFLKVARIVVSIAEADSAVSHAAYVWASSSKTVTDTVKKGLNDIINKNFPRTQPVNGNIPIVYCNDISKISRFAAISVVGVKSFIMAPLYVDGRFWAVLVVEEFRTRIWSESDRQLVSTASSVIAGEAIRALREKERNAALEQAKQASQAKTSFLANMSHEMRTPLNAIIGMTAIGKAAEDIERKGYCLEKIGEASNHLLSLINDVLDMSKIEANKFELSFADFSFSRMIQKTLTVINFRVEEKSQKLTVKIDEKIPDSLYGDEQRLSQIIVNLLSNAVKFTPEQGSVSLEAFLDTEGFAAAGKGASPVPPEKREKQKPAASSGEADPCVIRVSVADSGIGISAEQQARIFSSFTQADSSTSRKYGGTGLGLAISKNIVEMMGGLIWVESEPGTGSVFTFMVSLRRSSQPEAGKTALVFPGSGPAGENENLPEQGETPAAPSPENQDDFSGRRVLLAEDVELNREIVLALLEPTKLSVECVENGSMAVRIFNASPEAFDMIFMDIQMPEMDGYEATRAIRASAAPNAKTIPIIAMTANVFKEDVEKCLEAGMNGHVAKPLDFEGVLEQLRNYLPKT